MPYFDPTLKTQTFAEIGASLRAHVEAAEPKLAAIADADAKGPRAAGKWSRIQILGHLIDSAANNHQRFIRGQERDPLKLPGYAQEHWVGSQGYDQRAWHEVVALWSAYNRHLAHVIGRIPETRRDTRCEIGGEAPVALSFLALDYVGHLQHHLKQIFE